LDPIPKHILLSLLLACASGCPGTGYDNQSYIHASHRLLADPTPTRRDFKGINARHRVVVAVFDAGADYNHPELAANMRFDLDAAGKPVGIGRDFLAHDDWSSYHMVQTSRYPYAYLPEDTQKDLRDGHWTPEEYDRDLEVKVGEDACLNRALVREAPGLARYFDYFRHTADERLLTDGTAVAGLAAQGDPRIGLIPYRIYPYHQTPDEAKKVELGEVSKLARVFEEAVGHAAARGARVIHLGFNQMFNAPITAQTVEYQRALEQYNRLVHQAAEPFTAVLRAHPGILFIAPAGTGSRWTDNRTRVQFPCGVAAENLLCVGGLNVHGTIASFTNVPINGIPLIFAPAMNLASLAPSDRCPELDDVVVSLRGDPLDPTRQPLCRFQAGAGKWEADGAALAARRPMLRGLVQGCSSRERHYAKVEGVPFAAALVTHAAASLLVERPELTPPQVIDALRRDPRTRRMNSDGVFPYDAIRLEPKPWPARGAGKGPVLP
jgi:subtilisin family serine protease